MARTSSKVNKEEEVTQVIVEDVVAPVITEEAFETVPVEQAKPEQIKKHIIANSPTPTRKVPTLHASNIVGQLIVGTAYEIEKEVHSRTQGKFYLLSTGLYITQSGNYTIY